MADKSTPGSANFKTPMSSFGSYRTAPSGVVGSAKYSGGLPKVGYLTSVREGETDHDADKVSQPFHLAYEPLLEPVYANLRSNTKAQGNLNAQVDPSSLSFSKKIMPANVSKVPYGLSAPKIP